jgi:hypothetical protein
MSQFEIIKDIAETLKEMLKNSFKSAGFTTVNVSTEKPKKDNIKNLPTVSCYLYHLAFAPGYKERTQSLISTRDKDGKVVEYYQDAPLYMHAHFIISVHGNSVNEENLLLGLTGKTFLENPLLQGSILRGESFYPDDKLNLYPNLQSDFNDILQFWRSMNEEIRPALYYYVKFRIESDRKTEEIVRVTGTDIAVK